MKKCTAYLITLTAMLCFFTSSAYGAPILTNNAKGTQYREQIKSKMQKISELQRANKKLVRVTENKIKKIDELMMYMPENRVLSLEHIQQEMDAIQKNIQTDFEKIIELDSSIWKLLNTANKSIEKKDYITGINLLDRAIEKLEMKHSLLIQYDKSLDQYMKFIQSVELK
ncbi:hypothetical protein OXPF_38770 [Oxobacter pfennigii]|uniref:Uncharacterized protein n=1 Tax=Oxobacter pfennigii TaxID=36849 RepID=A0A0P8WK29_9CLOT|nr:hypothetical protein [Oxobacter pfennigii]KPU42577.1 hypothetical protein OXPF_38770 [Oxobacter pfennigii]